MYQQRGNILAQQETAARYRGVVTTTVSLGRRKKVKTILKELFYASLILLTTKRDSFWKWEVGLPLRSEDSHLVDDSSGGVREKERYLRRDKKGRSHRHGCLRHPPCTQQTALETVKQNAKPSRAWTQIFKQIFTLHTRTHTITSCIWSMNTLYPSLQQSEFCCWLLNARIRVITLKLLLPLTVFKTLIQIKALPCLILECGLFLL